MTVGTHGEKLKDMNHVVSGSFEGWPWTEETDPSVYKNIKAWPKISIVTPSYNQGIYIEQTIRSVLLQNYPNLEYIVIDGGSNDETVSILQQYSDRISFWVSEPDKGQSDALQKGFSKAKGEIFAWLNSDDFYDKDVLLKVATNYLQKTFSFFCGACKMIDEQGRLIQNLYTSKVNFTSLIRYWEPHFCPPQPSIFFTREAFEKLEPFNIQLRYAMDYDLWLSAVKNYSFTIIPENLSFYRVHSRSKTGSDNGFQKFIPEWKQVIHNHLKKRSVFYTIKFKLEEQLYFLKRDIIHILMRGKYKLNKLFLK